MSKQRKRGRTVSHRSANAARGDELRAGSTPAASANLNQQCGVSSAVEHRGANSEVARSNRARRSHDNVPELANGADCNPAVVNNDNAGSSPAVVLQNPTLAAAGEMQRKISLGENGCKKRRKYSVEKFLSHPQFCSLGSITNIDKAKYDANFEAIFGKKPPPPDFGPREGYNVRPYRGRHEAILIGDEEITDDERKALKAKMLKRLRAAKK